MIGSKDEYALVTGASSGMDYEFAKLFAKDGKNTVIISNEMDKLEEVKSEIENKHGTIVKVLAKDLSESNSPQEIYSELEEDGVNVDVLVNCAGFTVWGRFAETDWQKEAEMIQVNITSLTQLTKLYVRKMLEEGSGWILNVASVCAFMPQPLNSIYCASKSYVMNFSEAIAYELKRTPVKVTCLCPVGTATRFVERANMQNCRGAQMKMMDAATVAKIGYKSLQKGKVIVIPSRQYRLSLLLLKFVPRRLILAIGNRMLKPI